MRLLCNILVTRIAVYVMFNNLSMISVLLRSRVERWEYFSRSELGFRSSSCGKLRNPSVFAVYETFKYFKTAATSEHASGVSQLKSGFVSRCQSDLIHANKQTISCDSKSILELFSVRT